MTKRKFASMLMLTAMLAGVLAGCGNSNSNNEESKQPANSASAETPYIEFWTVNDQGYKNFEKDGPTSQQIIKDVGVGIYAPVVAWDGGNNYLQKLQTRIASGDLPDLFIPWNGIENDLAKQGALADLTDLLPKYAPHVYDRIPQEIWDVVKSSDPTGQGKIYYIPAVTLTSDYGGFIRQDWLDKLGLSMPKTQEEYVKVLTAFRDQDPNGNGQKDELPVSGRELGRWMDNIFGMYGVAMFEGYPAWDLYDGELTYSGVTPNMKDALQFMNKLYKENLLDNNTFLNKGNDWWSRITSEKVGTWFHNAHGVQITAIDPIAKVNPDVKIAALPAISAEGYKGFTTHTNIGAPTWAVANKSEETTINVLKVIDWINNPANAKATNLGIEGMHYTEENGKIKVSAAEKNTQENILYPSITDKESVEALHELTLNILEDDQKWAEDMKYQITMDIQPAAKTIAGDGIPSSIYEGFADIKNHTLYQEYMTKIIIGELPIDAFDEFVDKWKKTGGDEVTKRARAWYSQLNK